MLLPFIFLTTNLYFFADAYKADNCPSSYCSGGQIMYVCSSNKGCGSERRLPNSWFRHGVQLYGDNTYQHYIQMGLSCLPACTFSSNHPKMPSKISFNTISLSYCELSFGWSRKCWSLVRMVLWEWSLSKF